MFALDLTLPTLPANLALDEALLLEAEAGRGGEGLRFWEWPTTAVVLGAAGVIADDVDVAACRADGVPLARRSSGGGTVLLGKGCLLFSLVLRFDRAAELAVPGPSYRFILGRIAEALSSLVPSPLRGGGFGWGGGEPETSAEAPGALPPHPHPPPHGGRDPEGSPHPHPPPHGRREQEIPWRTIATAGISDLAVAGQKFSGNAQQRKREFFLHHGSILYGLDLGIVGRYLKPPPRQPDYRARRGHDEFLTNLSAGPVELKERLRAAWGAEREVMEWPTAVVDRLVAEKFVREEWVMRR